jgi:thiol-disulfide isomerase/thioredoxin
MPTEAAETLETMRPAADWDPASHEAEIETLADESLTFRVWSGDWCPDCREQLPAFAAALEAAGVPDERLYAYPVERTDEGKEGPEMDAYDVDRIPTVIVERDGEEVARFVESGPLPITATLARELAGEA